MATTEWQSITLGQNKTIQDIAEAASKASELLDANVKLAQGTLKAAGIFLTGILGPYILLLRTTADTIDDYVKDFKNIGFFILEVNPDGKYVLPEDADGNPIKIIVGAAEVATRMALASAIPLGECDKLKSDGSKYGDIKSCKAAGGKWDLSKGGGGLAAEFKAWAKEFLGEEDIYLTGAQKANYEVPVGKSEPESRRRDNANDNTLAARDETTGLYKMTPSQVIATIIAAMDDELDLRRPQLSKSAEAGAIVMIVGISDLTKNLPNLQSIVKAFLTFFGGEEKIDKDGKVVAAGGIATGMAKLGGLVEAALLQVNDPTLNNVTLKVKNVCKARGDEDDKIKLGRVGVPYLIEGVFEVNDFVVGPRVKFGARCMGYVSEIISTEPDEEDDTYSTQELKIAGITELDAIGFRSLSSGAKLQKVAFVEKYNNFVDQNTGKSIQTGPFNDFEYLPNLSETDAKSAKTKVKREKGKTLLTMVGSGENIAEVHSGEAGAHHVIQITTNNTTVGDIPETKVSPAPPPNFKAAKLEDMIGDFKVFFMAIDALTDTLRKMADDAGKALQDIIDYLDAKIKELDEINKALQKILALFSIGLPAGGIYTLNIPVAVGGTEYIKSELQGAANAPPDDLDFTMAFMLVGEGIAFKTLQKLLIPS